MSATILIVDDDYGLRATLQAVLEDEGYTVTTAVDGLDALAKLEGETPGLILLDLGMPRLDGYDLAEELVRRGLRPAVPVVVLTADGRAAEKAARIGADDWLAKPFAVDRLLAQVRRLLAGRV
jgi:two-component system response regulator MprA